MDTIESSPSASVEGIVTSDIENATSSVKNEAQVLIDPKDYIDDIDNYDGDEGGIILVNDGVDDEEVEYEEDEEDDDNHDADRESYGLSELQDEDEHRDNRLYKCRHEQHKQDQLYKEDFYTESMLCKPSSSTSVRNMSSCSINTVNNEQASSSLLDGKPISVDVQQPTNNQSSQSQQEEQKEHLKRLKNLRKHIDYIEQTNWLYTPIDELIGHTENTNKKL